MTPEGKLKSDVVAALNDTGIFYLRVNSGRVKVRGGWMNLAPEGTADILCFPAGGVLWIELKAPGQKTAKERVQKQAGFRDRVIAAGHRHAVCTSVQQVLVAIGYSREEEVA